MILLLGGTSETGPIARALAAKGRTVLVSTATDEELDIGTSPAISRRTGRLDATGLATLASKQEIQIIVDAGHPYAVELHKTAASAARSLGIPLLRYLRPSISKPAAKGIIRAATHSLAAKQACSFEQPILLTTGSKDIGIYAEAAQKLGVKLVARVLPRADSVNACLHAGLPGSCIIAARGPFSTNRNIEHIRQFGIRTIVTKDSGTEGGLQEKIDAAAATGCRLIVVQRPDQPAGPTYTYSTVSRLVQACLKHTTAARRR